MKALNAISLNDVKRVMVAKGYKIFTGNGIPNIVGIRSALTTANIYDDTCFVFYNDNGVEKVNQYTITTNPSEYYLRNKILDKKGAAILVPGQYLNTWILGLHGSSKQFALLQRGGEVKVYRDNNKDEFLNYDPSTIDTGYFGINLHRGDLSDSKTIGVWSAGCQVWQYHEPHFKLMTRFKELSEANKFNKFSYTLLEQKDFE